MNNEVLIMISLAGFMLILPISILVLLKDLCGNSRRNLMRMKSEQERLRQKVKMVSRYAVAASAEAEAAADRAMEIKHSEENRSVGCNATKMTCENCGAPLDGSWKCRYCGTQYLITNKTSL